VLENVSTFETGYARFHSGQKYLLPLLGKELNFTAVLMSGLTMLLVL
jgi:hypothetical protein